MILRRQGLCSCTLALWSVCSIPAHAAPAQPNPDLPAPIVVYSRAPGFATGQAAPPVSEEAALADLGQLVRLKSSGLRVDYDLINASDLAPDDLHPAGTTAAWPHGPDAWIARCRAAGIQPGLRFAPLGIWGSDTNTVARAIQATSGDFLAALQSWYNRGIRLFLVNDLGDSDASPLPAAILAFRQKNRGAVVITVERIDHSAPHNTANDLEAFTWIATGPLHPADAPQSSLERAVDIATDNEVRSAEQAGFPPGHILTAGLIATPAASGSGSSSLPRAWKGAFLLSMARGGRVQMLSGRLDFVRSEDARWMARAEKLFFDLEAQGQMRSFGGAASGNSTLDGQPYGYAGATTRGAVYVGVNPGEAVATLSLPPLVAGQPSGPERILFRDAGYSPRLAGDALTLGPGQMVVVGFGSYAAPESSLGVQQEIVIPNSIAPVDADFHLTAPGVLEASIDPPIQGVLRVIVRERDPGGAIGNDAAAKPVSIPRFTFEITQGGRPIPLRPDAAGRDGDSLLIAGLSWAVAEIDVNDLTPGVAVRVRVRADANGEAGLEGRAYQVTY